MNMKKGQKVRVLYNSYSSFELNEIVEYIGIFGIEDKRAIFKFTNSCGEKQWLFKGDFELINNEESIPLIAMVNFEGFSDLSSASNTYYFLTNLTDLKVGDTVIVDSLGRHQKANFLGYTDSPEFTPTKYIIRNIIKNKESELSKETVFKPSNIELVDDRIILHFNKDDISVYIKGEMYKLQSYNVKMDIRIENQKVLNKDKFIFESATGRKCAYHSMQVKALYGVQELLNKVINESVDTGDYIKVNHETETLVNEIMQFHKDNLIDKYLEEEQLNITVLEELSNLKFI